jgi:hypothetical protein
MAACLRKRYVKTKMNNAGSIAEYYKATVECLHLIYWPQIQSRFYYHTAKPEPNWRVSNNCLPLLVGIG